MKGINYVELTPVELQARQSKKKRTIYFGKDVQDAILQYNSGELTDTQRSRLYNKLIYPAFMKLAENIINKWKFHNYETTYSDLKHDAVVALTTKLNGYDVELGKAYSYFTIICKNFLIKTSQDLYNNYKDRADLQHVDLDRNINSELTYTDYQEELKDFIMLWTNWLDNNLTSIFKSKKDQKIADAAIELLRNSSEIDLYNKKLFYILIRERSGVETHHVTKVMKVIKEMFMSMFKTYRTHGKLVP